MELYTADWVLPINSDPVRDGAVVVDRDRIVFVGTRSEAMTRPEFNLATSTDLGRVALLPGLINTHSHLELTLLRGFLEDLQFRDWIHKLTITKQLLFTEEDLAASALLGTVEAIRAGVTTLADTGDSRAPFDAIRTTGLRGIAYREVFGPDPVLVGEALEELHARVDEMRRDQTDLVRVGVSPHAIYTCSEELFSQVAGYARRESLDLATHAAESEAEQQLMLAGAGEFANALLSRGIEWRAPGISTIKYFDSIGVLDVAPLLVHCVKAGEEDINLLARRRVRVAHCPKSNAKLGHGIAPLRELQSAGVPVGLGTDSVASNNRCDLIGEARFCGLIHRATSNDYARPSANELLRLATLDGARALGLESKIGSLEPGKQADIIAIDLWRTHSTPVHDPVAAVIFSAVATDVVMTMVAGRVLFENDEVKPVDEHGLQNHAAAVLSRLQSA